MMRRETFSRFFSVLVIALVSLVSPDAAAAGAPIAVEVSPFPASLGTDVAALRRTAEGEIRQMGVAFLRDRRRVVISLALTRAPGDPVVYTVNGTLRDARTGVMLGIIEAGARAEGPISPELRKQVAYAAVRKAVRGIPRALSAK